MLVVASEFATLWLPCVVVVVCMCICFEKIDGVVCIVLGDGVSKMLF